VTLKYPEISAIPTGILLQERRGRAEVCRLRQEKDFRDAIEAAK
jgi:hypothetical protein